MNHSNIFIVDGKFNNFYDFIAVVCQIESQFEMIQCYAEIDWFDRSKRKFSDFKVR